MSCYSSSRQQRQPNNSNNRCPILRSTPTEPRPVGTRITLPSGTLTPTSACRIKWTRDSHSCILPTVVRWFSRKCSTANSQHISVSCDNSHLITVRCYACVVLAMGLCLCASVTSRCFTKTAKHLITQTKPHASLGTLVFWCGHALLGRQN